MITKDLKAALACGAGTFHVAENRHYYYQLVRNYNKEETTGEPMNLYRVTVRCENEAKNTIRLEDVFVLAESDYGARSQALCTKDTCDVLAVVQVPFLVRGWPGIQF